jgi:outer membrane autotransporter protein
MQRCNLRLVAFGLGLVGSTALSSIAIAQTWIGPSTGNWGDAANWSGGVPASVADWATLTGSGTYNINIDGPFTIGGMDVTSGSFSIQSSSGELTFGGSNPKLNLSSPLAILDAVSVAGGVELEKAGSATLNLYEALNGSVLVSDGTLNLGYSSAYGSVRDNVRVTGGLLTTGASATFSIGSLSGTGGTVDIASGSTLMVGSFLRDTSFEGAITGSGGLLKHGGGRLTLDGASSFTGATNVRDAGTALIINNSFASAVTVYAGALVGGIGTISQVMSTGGTVSPGSSGIGTLQVGNVTLDGGSTFAVEIDGVTSDRLDVTGTANFNGATVSVTAPGNKALGTTYRIVNAGTIASGFDPVVSESLVLFDAALVQSATSVDLILTRNSSGLYQPGQTGNQGATAMAIDGLGLGNQLNTDAATAYVGDNTLFDQLSGEGHASARSALLRQSENSRNAAFGRLGQIEAQPGAGAGLVSSYVETSGSSFAMGASTGVWASLGGQFGVINQTGNTAALDLRGGGMTLGLDGLLGDTRLGAMLHAGQSSVSAHALGTTIQSADYGVGIYGATELVGLDLKFGADYQRHAISSNRTVPIGGAVQTLTANYGGATAQAFTELSRDFELDQFKLTPFANLALVNVSTDSFSETGGSAALSSAASSDTYLATTIGARGSAKAALGTTLVEASAGIGWRHVFGDNPVAANSFAGGSPFSITGAPVASNALVLEGDLTLDLSEHAALMVDYAGEFSGTGLAHSVKATFGGRF